METVEGARLTHRSSPGNVKYMRRMVFAGTYCSTFAGSPAGWVAGSLAVALAAPAAGAQQVPGRDLLKITIGTLAESPALAAESGDGVWNPAAVLLPGGYRGRLSVAALQGAPDQGLDAQLLAASVAVPARLTVGVSVLRASVDGLVRTESDPQTIGPEIPYNTTMISVHVAQQRAEHVVGGVALRYRMGQMDGDRHGEFGVDAGVMATRITRADLRIGASSFLWQPAEAAEAHASFNVAADARVAGKDSSSEGRLGYGFGYTLRGAREHYGVGTLHMSRVIARAGVAHSREFGESEWRLRLGVGLHYARYILGVAREENGAGLSPTYQFTLSALIR